MKILVPIDGSKFSLHGLEVASDYAKNRKVEIYLLTVVPLTADKGYEIAPHSRGSVLKELKENSEAKLQKAKAILESEDIPVQLILRNGNYSISEEIIKTAEEKKIDLIVIGSRGLSGAKSLLLGSTAAKVARDCSCSVYVVKKPH